MFKGVDFCSTSQHRAHQLRFVVGVEVGQKEDGEQGRGSSQDVKCSAKQEREVGPITSTFHNSKQLVKASPNLKLNIAVSKVCASTNL